MNLTAWRCIKCREENLATVERCSKCNNLPYQPLKTIPAPTATDEQFSQWLLKGPDCFCGALCEPVNCWAYGYCAAHSTPLAAQMLPDVALRLLARLRPGAVPAVPKVYVVFQSGVRAVRTSLEAAQAYMDTKYPEYSLEWELVNAGRWRAFVGNTPYWIHEEPVV